MGKIRKILENELIGGTQDTDIYPVTSIKAVYNENNERLDDIITNKCDGLTLNVTGIQMEYCGKYVNNYNYGSLVPATSDIDGLFAFVNPNTEYRVGEISVLYSNAGVQCYRGDKTDNIGYLEIVDGKFTTLEGTKSIVISVNKAQVGKVFLKPANNTLKEDIENNEQKIEVLKAGLYESALVEPIEVIPNSYLNSGGAISSYSGQYNCRVYKVNPGEVYNIQGLKANASNTLYVCWKSNEDRTIVYKPSVDVYPPVDIVVPEGCTAICTTHDAKLYSSSGKNRLDTIEYNIEQLKTTVEGMGGKTVKTLLCYGDSLTAGSDAAFDSTTGTGPYVSVLKSLLGSSWNVLNKGIGGEDSATIAGRQGGVPFYITDDIDLPSDTSQVVLPKGTGLGIANTCNGYTSYTTKLLCQGGLINPITINGIECTLTKTGQYTATEYQIKRTTAGEATKLLKGSFIYTQEMKVATTADMCIIFIGQNGGYDSAETLVEQVKAMIKFCNCGEQYITITSHGNGYENIRNAFDRAFGAKNINLQTYLPNYGIRDAVRYGLASSDEMAGHTWDDGTLKPSNDVHLTSLGYAVVAHKIYETMKNIGYIK